MAFLSLVVGGMFLAPSSNAQTTFTWSPTGADFVWSQKKNWSPTTAPGNNAVAAFVWNSASTGLTSTNDRTGIVITNLLFTTNAGASTLLGNAVTLSNNGSINNLSGNTQTIGFAGITLATGFTVNAASNGIIVNSAITNGGNLLTVTGGNNTSLNGILSGTGGLTKTGAGTLTLHTNNSYGGATVIGGGVVVAAQLANSGTNSSIGSGSAIVFSNSGGLLRYTGGSVTINRGVDLVGSGGFDISNSATALTLSGSISNSGALVKQGGGTLVLSGSNTYSGGTFVGAGVLQVGAGGVTGTLGGGNVTNDASLVFNRTGGLLVTNVISGSGTLAKTGAGTVTLSGANTYTGSTLISEGALQIGNGGTTGSLSTSSAITNNGTLIFNRSDNIAQGTTFSAGAISGTGMLVKNGAGTLTLGSANTYSGTTTINAGALRATNAAALGTTAAGTTVANGAALELAGGIAIGAEALTLNGSGISGGGALRNISGSNSYGGLITLGSNARINSDSGTLNLTNTGTITGTNTISVGGAGNTIIQSVIGTGVGGVVKDGAGTLILSGSNTFTGGIDIHAGVLQVGSDANLGGSGASVEFDQTGTGVLRTTAGFSSGRDYVFSTAGTLDVTTNSLVLNGLLSGGGTLIKTGAGTLVINTDSNAQFGGMLISAGALQVGNGGGVGALNSGNITNNSHVIFNRTGELLVTNDISGTGIVTKEGAGTVTLAGNGTYSGQTVVSAGALVLSNTSGNAISGSSIRVDGGSQLVLAADNQIGDSTGLILNGGTFIVGTGSAGYSDVLGTLTVSASSTIDLGAFAGRHTIQFADSSAISWAEGAILTITNWQGIAMESGEAGQILFGIGGLTSTQLAQIYWADQEIQGGALIGNDGELTPIPEARVVWGAAALLAAVVWRERRRVRSFLRRG